MSGERNDVVIVGAGAMGCAVAYFLGLDGVGSTIVERDEVAAHASGYSAGGLNPLEGAGIPGPLGPLAITSYRMHKEIWPDLKGRSRIDFGPRVVSSVRVAFDEADVPEMEASFDVFDSADDAFSARWLSAAQLRDIEPRISHDALCALETSGNAALDSYRYTQALARSADTLGAEFRSDTVTGIEAHGGKVTSVLTGNGKIPCGAVVFAAGPWSGEVGRWLGVTVPVEPYKGEMLRMRPRWVPTDRDIQGAGVSLYRRERDQVWIGATEEKKGFDASPSARGEEIADERGAEADAGDAGCGSSASHGVSEAADPGLAADSRESAGLGKRISRDRGRKEGYSSKHRDRQGRRGHGRTRQDRSPGRWIRAVAVRGIW